VLRAARAAIGTLAPIRRTDAGLLRIAVALSGGRDSMALLDALATLAPELGIALSAVHVHHGLSANADAWAAFCADEGARRGVPVDVHRVRVDRISGASPEAAARAARYTALAATDADAIALAHHADDQAETLLLQLLRGAGPHGLAAMPVLRSPGEGPPLLRPFLALPRAALDTYVAARGLAWVDDESNAFTSVRRNFLRHEVAPRLAAAFPGYPATLSRAASHQAEAALLLDDLARLDARAAIVDTAAEGPVLDRGALIALAGSAPHRARNLLRWFLRRHALAAPPATRLAAMLDQLVHAAPDARVRLAHAGAEIGLHRGRIVVHAPAVAPFAVAWHGEPLLALPHGTLEFAPCVGTALARAALACAPVTIRRRAGGERIRLAGDRPRRALKRILQDAGMPPWQRQGLPLVFCGDALAAVPGIGVDAAFRAAPGAPGFEVRWQPGAGVADPGADRPLPGGKG
jgi:tRNA(Ile)-lysidine synthase